MRILQCVSRHFRVNFFSSFQDCSIPEIELAHSRSACCPICIHERSPIWKSWISPNLCPSLWSQACMYLLPLHYSDWWLPKLTLCQISIGDLYISEVLILLCVLLISKEDFFKYLKQILSFFRSKAKFFIDDSETDPGSQTPFLTDESIVFSPTRLWDWEINTYPWPKTLSLSYLQSVCLSACSYRGPL